MKKQIWVVEDEPGLQMGLSDLFANEGLDVQIFGSGEAVMRALAQLQPDVMVLDLGLPDMDGNEILHRCRAVAPKLPVLVLTARASESDILRGFKLGAMDYVTKPFSPRVLVARVQALMQRVEKNDKALRFGEVTIDFEGYSALRGGEHLHLTTREFDILKLLYLKRNRPVSRMELLEEVWGMESDAGPRTVDTHIASLRKKIEPVPEKPQFILSRRGIGYKLVWFDD